MPLNNIDIVSSPSPQTPGSDDYLTPNEHLSLTSARTSSNKEYNTVPQPSLPSSSWISLRNQMKMLVPKSILLCTTYS
ncbi:unnamed protein product [Adineta steineri]|uniref:Uncharacterized protein n=1 Tax=Adineta steineri TaxID=433720 RepID=A0A814FED8_9BILA|nr:unnamed protein product [Adineta steineri]CAF1077157.1 unnamed protein product [Adineta steineri]CAF1438835.1 unnamed protein product [Adineta steineri]